MGRDQKGQAVQQSRGGPQSVPTPARAGGRDRNRNGGGEKSRGPGSPLEDLMKRRGVDEAWSALEDMQRQGASTDKYTVSRMLMKTVGDGRARLNPSRVYRGISLVERFIELQPKDVDEVLFNALLDTCCRLKDLGRLETTVRRMRDLQVTPSPVTLGILVKTYGQVGDLPKVLQVWDEMATQRDQANAVTYGCMIDACVKCGHMAKAVEIFKGMREAGKHRNTILYTTLIKGYGLEKDLPSALQLFREMPVEGVPYNTITYNSMLDACIKCGDLSTAEGLLREMKAPESTLEPDLITFSTLLKGYCNVGDLDRALQVAEAIKACGLRCDELVYNTLMDGCVKAGDVSAGIGLFEEMVQNGMQPSTITHSILTRLYQRAGYDDDAAEAVVQLYQHHGVERPMAGDRGKGASRRRGSGNQSPVSSVCSDGGWSVRSSGLGLAPFDGGFMDPSAPSTPAGSPLASPARQQGQAYLPIEAFGAPFVPQLPGGSGQAYAPVPGMMQFQGGCTPTGAMMPNSAVGSVAGSHGGTPCGSPTGRMDASFFPVPQSPHGVRPGFGPAGAQGMMPSMPPWPVACAAGPSMPAPPQCAPMHMGGDGSVQQVYAMPACGGETAVMGMAPPPAQMPMQPDGSSGGVPMQQPAYFAGWVSGDQPC